RREDRDWVDSDEWRTLFLAALTELTEATVVEFRIVTGLPVAFFEGDKVKVRDRLLGDHRTKRPNRRAQMFKVTEAHVIPQPFGTLLSVCLDDRGAIVDQALATGKVGVVDIGGKTTNLLSVNRLAEISAETDSVNVGAWDMVRSVRRYLSNECPDLDIRDHEIIEAVIARQVKYYGQPVDLTAEVNKTLEPMADQVMAAASEMWNGGAGLDAILIAGGGALLLGPYIAPQFNRVAGRPDFARVVPDPVFANARGYWRFAQRLARE
ncbi:MAG: ParM/StbA family protein, partial [Chloroflexi bacterium]|nr:ParM/StbA family protein [Chloroflexota bacterium]